jgi:hypothetical protein
MKMRKITKLQIIIFLLIEVPVLIGSFKLVHGIFLFLEFGSFHGVLTAVGTVFLSIYTSAVASRFFLYFFPLKAGVIEVGSRDEFIYNVYTLFHLIIFHPFIKTGILPVPFMRGIYTLLGAKLGGNTHPTGILFDPGFITLGKDCIVGQNAILIPHVLEGNKLEYHPIEIGDNVTIGASSVVLAGTTVGDNVIIAAGSVVPKHTHIPAGQTWGGVPAKVIYAPV